MSMERERREPDDGRSTRAAQLRSERRRELLDVALSVFAQRGYHQTRISDIIEAAQVARGTFYLYFESKHAIFAALLDDVLGRIRGAVVGVELGSGAPSLRAQIHGTLVRLLSLVREEPALSRLVLREAVGLDPTIDEKLSSFYDELHRWLTDALLNGQALGLLRPFDPTLVAWTILGSVERSMRLLLERPRSFSVDAMADALLDAHLVGLLSGPAVE
jgi:AcrR family transcriptional regulator